MHLNSEREDTVTGTRAKVLRGGGGEVGLSRGGWVISFWALVRSTCVYPGPRVGWVIGSAIFIYPWEWVILFYNRNWHTLGTIQNRGNSFQFQIAKIVGAVAEKVHLGGVQQRWQFHVSLNLKAKKSNGMSKEFKGRHFQDAALFQHAGLQDHHHFFTSLLQSPLQPDVLLILPESTQVSMTSRIQTSFSPSKRWWSISLKSKELDRWRRYGQKNVHFQFSYITSVVRSTAKKASLHIMACFKFVTNQIRVLAPPLLRKPNLILLSLPVAEQFNALCLFFHKN